MIPTDKKEILRKAIRYDQEKVIEFLNRVDWSELELAYKLTFEK